MRYTEVHAALARMHQPITDTALRGRITNLQRLGIARLAPGKGSKIDYSLDDVLLWAFALELEECGMDPIAVAKIITSLWPETLKHRPASDSDRFFYIEPTIMSDGRWRDAGFGDAKAVTTMLESSRRLIVINISRLTRQTTLAIAIAARESPRRKAA